MTSKGQRERLGVIRKYRHSTAPALRTFAGKRQGAETKVLLQVSEGGLGSSGQVWGSLASSAPRLLV